LSFNVQVRRAAELDVAAAQIWYETQRSGLGAEFHFEVSRVFTRLVETPLIYSAVYQDIRRAIVHRFPYLIWYRVQGKDVPFWHARTADRIPTKPSHV
jgi:hypothetical protein